MFTVMKTFYSAGNVA